MSETKYISKRSDVNKWMGTGRVTQVVERRDTPSGIPVCDIKIAVNKYVKGTQYTVYPRITCWNKTAEVMSDPKMGLKVGDLIHIEGELVDDNFLVNKDDETSITHGRIKIDNSRITIMNRVKKITDKEE